MGRAGGEHQVQPGGPLALVGGVDDGLPGVQHRVDVRQVVGRERSLDHQPGRAAAVHEFVDAPRPLVRQLGGQVDGVLAVRVEVHKTITAV